MTQLVLYHAPNAVCAAKVRLVLAEKALPYDSRLLDFARDEQLDPAYLRLNPNGVVPTLVHDGRTLTESTVIAEYLDDAFAAHPLRPADADGRARSQLWTRREDAVHAVINTLTTLAVFRPQWAGYPPADRQARLDRIPSRTRRIKLAALLDHGADSPIVVDDLASLARQLRDMNAALATSAWLGGAAFGLADAGLIAFFYRLELLSLASLWQDLPHIAKWLDACKQRPSFAAAVAGFVPPPLIEHYKNAGLVTKPAVLAVYSRASALI